MTIPTQDHPSPAIPSMPVYRFTSEQYRGMIRAGTFANEWVELLDGWIVRGRTIHRPQVIARLRTFHAVRTVVRAGWHAEQKAPLTVSDLSTPSPDTIVIRGRPEDYPDDPPTAADAALVVEVIDSSYRDDRRKKLPLYAASGIPFYWLVDLAVCQVEVYDDPTGPSPAPAYRRCATFGLADEIPLVVDGTVVARIAARILFP